MKTEITTVEREVLCYLHAPMGTEGPQLPKLKRRRVKRIPLRRLHELKSALSSQAR